jgi:molybdate transport system ATP-binding protein
MSSASGESLVARVVVDYSARGARGFRLDAELEAPPGVTILFGPSGAGKTSLLDAIAGLARPAAGRVALGDEALFDSARGINLPAERRRIGYVFQSLALFPHLSAQANVEYGIRRSDKGQRRERAQALMESLRIAHLAPRRPGEISGGERQRVALARALVTEPRALLLDEPLAALDLGTQSRIMEDLRAWNAARRIPVLYVTHSHREAFALGERMMLLEGGRIVARGSPHQVLRMPEQETLAQAAGFENIFDAVVIARHEPQGTMTCRVARSELALEVPLTRAALGDAVRIAVRAGDILLAAAPPAQISARNILRGRIAELEEKGWLVVARVDCSGAEFLADLTPGARDALALTRGREVWLVVKSHSCFLLSAASSAQA